MAHLKRQIFALTTTFMLIAIKGSQNYCRRFMWIHKAHRLSPSCAGNFWCSIHQLCTYKKGKVWICGQWVLNCRRTPGKRSVVPATGWTALSLWLIIRYCCEVHRPISCSLDQHIWTENKKEIHNLQLTKYSWAKNKFYFYVIFTPLEKSKMRW